MSLYGPLSGVGVGEDVAYLGTSDTLVITDTAGISLGFAGPASATSTQPSGAWVTGFASTVNNTGGVTSQPVHFVTSVVRIDDNNHDPIVASDVDGCIAIGNGSPVDCDSGYFSLITGKTTGSFDGRPAVFFRYPNLAANDTPLPNTAGPITAPMEFRFAPGEYRFISQVVGSNDGTMYATSSTLVTTVPDAQIALAGSFTGSLDAEAGTGDRNCRRRQRIGRLHRARRSVRCRVECVDQRFA